MKRYSYFTVKGRKEIIKKESSWYKADEVDKKIERLREALENIRIHAYKTEEDADYEVLNKAVTTIWEMCEQALIEG